MRKVLSFVLVLSLVLGSFGMAFAAPLSDIAGEKCEDAVNVLTDLEVVTGYPDGDYRPENIVTRAEMAVIVVRALGLADYAVGTSSFKDMAGHWSNAYVAYATGLGIIDGYPDGTFKPDKTVSYDEASKMLIAALGYTPDSLVGTWPANYVVKAKALGILDGIKAGAAGANRGDIAIMAYQTLNQKIGSTNKDGDWTAFNSGTVAEPVYDTMLDRLGASKAKDGKAFVLSSQDADGAVANVRNYVGAYVKAYENSDGDIIAISEVKSVFLTGKYKDADGAFVADDVEYNVPTNTVYGDDNVSAAAIENGVTDGLTNAAVVSLTSDVTIAAKVSGKTIKEIYSVATWTVDAAGIIDKYDIEAIKEDQELFDYEFTLDDNDEIDANSFALYGVDSVDDIKIDDVVYISVGGANDKITRVQVSDKVVTGKITAISSDYKYTIDGTKYSLSKADDAITTSNAILNIKNEIKAFLDYDGKIYDAEKLSGDADKFAIVLQTEPRDTTKIATSEAKAKLFLADGSDKVFTIKKDADIMHSNEMDVNVSHGALVKYSVNNDGVIDSMKIVSTTGDGINISAKGTLSIGKKLTSDVKVFTVDSIAYPTTSALSEDDYGTGTYTSILDITDVDVVYSVNGDGLVDAILVAGGLGDESYGLMVGYGKNIDGDYLELLVDGNKATYDSDVAGSGFDMVTLYKVEFNASGGIKNLTAHGLDSVTGAATSTSKMSISLNGYVLKVTSTGALNGNITEGEEYTLDNDVVVYVYDTANSKYKIGKLADIRGNAEAIDLFDADTGDDADGVYDIVLIKK